MVVHTWSPKGFYFYVAERLTQSEHHKFKASLLDYRGGPDYTYSSMNKTKQEVCICLHQNRLKKPWNTRLSQVSFLWKCFLLLSALLCLWYWSIGTRSAWSKCHSLLCNRWQLAISCLGSCDPQWVLHLWHLGPKDVFKKWLKTARLIFDILFDIFEI